MQKILFILAMYFALLSSALAQQTVTGKVTGDDGLVVPGVNVIEKGTNNGVITNFEGVYNIKVASDAILIFSSIGLETVEEAINGRSTINIIMAESVIGLDEVVVTALGIKRDKKSLGYAISTVKGDELTVAGNTSNPILALYGQAAGVGVQGGSSGPMGGINITIRGAAGLETSSKTRPLFVVDGVPIYDEESSMASRGYDPLNSFDYGSGINDINPEDIESMEILKGAKASVLYGSEGANGVVLITTKKGKKTRGLGVNVNWQKTWEKPHSYINFQNKYGSGTSIYDTETTIDPNGNEVRDIIKSRFNFGPAFDGTPIMFLDSITRPYQAYPDNFIDLFQTGMTDNKSYSGKYSYLINAANPYSPTLELPSNSIETQKASIHFWTYQEKENSARAVVCIEDGEESLFRADIFLKDQLSKNQEWVHFQETISLPSIKNERAIFKVYIWNPDSSKVYIDDLTIRFPMY